MEKHLIHEGHRQRLKNKFLQSGFQSFEPHNILELLLFYSIPRRDTNEIAHELLNRFGSLKGVFEASFEELIKVDGIKENSATLLKMIPLVAREYFTDCTRDKPVFDTAGKIGQYFVAKYIGEVNEVVYAMLLNNKFEMLTVIKVHEGSVNSANASARKIIDAVVRFNASMVVLAHNHPSGTICPSMDDIQTTSSILSALKVFEVALIEHFVIAGNEYCPIIHNTESLRKDSRENRDFFRKSIELEF